MDKKNLKKAALLGLMIGAAAVSAPAVAHEPTSSQGMVLAHSCGGGSCGAKKGGNIATSDEPTTQYQPGTGHSCGSAPAAPQNGKRMPQTSCSGAAVPQGTYYNNGTAPQGGGCNSVRPRTNGY